jgi:hypothetical protein
MVLKALMAQTFFLKILFLRYIPNPDSKTLVGNDFSDSIWTILLLPEKRQKTVLLSDSLQDKK